MKISLENSRIGIIAVAAAGIVAAGTVGERASEIYGKKAETTADPTAAVLVADD
jgi:hypothetical protein